MEEVVIVAARRTPIAKFLGAFSPLSAVDLGAAAVEGMLTSVGVEASDVEELIFGQARQLGSGPNPARQVAIRAGISESAPAYTVNKACGSSLKCIDLGRAAICLDDRKIVVVGWEGEPSNEIHSVLLETLPPISRILFSFTALLW